jgi:hypothetical protein
MYGGYTWQIMSVLDWLIGFIVPSLYNLNYKPYSTIPDFHTFQFTVAHALGLSVSTGKVSQKQKLPLQFTMKSSCHFFFDRLGMLTQFSNSVSPSWLYCMVLICTQLIFASASQVQLTDSHLQLSLYGCGSTCHAENTAFIPFSGADDTEKNSTVLLRGACWNVFTEPLPSNALSKSVTIKWS